MSNEGNLSEFTYTDILHSSSSSSSSSEISNQIVDTIKNREFYQKAYYAEKESRNGFVSLTRRIPVADIDQIVEEYKQFAVDKNNWISEGNWTGNGESRPNLKGNHFRYRAMDLIHWAKQASTYIAASGSKATHLPWQYEGLIRRKGTVRRNCLNRVRDIENIF